MALEKRIVIDRREILGLGQIQCRQRTDILEDGKVISSSYRRWVLEPGDDLTKQDETVKRVANAEWTNDVKQTWNDFKAQQKEAL